MKMRNVNGRIGLKHVESDAEEMVEWVEKERRER
jgi:hypothetical protein